MESYELGLSAVGIKSMGVVTLRGIWLDAYQRLERDRRIARRTGATFVVRSAWGRRYYWFDTRPEGHLA